MQISHNRLARLGAIVRLDDLQRPESLRQFLQGSMRSAEVIPAVILYDMGITILIVMTECVRLLSVSVDSM